jgi:hypothetical protein
MPKETSAKNVMNSWVIEIIGPGPAAGHWHDITKKTNSVTPIWKWSPTREDLFTFILDDGYWIFKGREPFFNWESNLWKFSGNEPELLFYTDKEQTKRFYVENNQLHITKSSDQAKAKMKMLKESFNPKYNLESDKTLSDETGKAKAEHINMFYKSENENKSDESEQRSNNPNKGRGFKEEQGGTLTGEGKTTKQADIESDQTKSTKLELENNAPPLQKRKTKTKKANERKSEKSFEAPIDRAPSKSHKGFYDEEGGSLTGHGGADRKQSNMSGSGKIREEIERQISKRKKTNHEQFGQKSNSNATSPLDLDTTPMLNEEEFDQLREDLRKDLKKESELELEAGIQNIEQKTKEKKESQSLEEKVRNNKPPLRSIDKNQNTPKENKKSDYDSLSGVLDAPIDLGAEGNDGDLPSASSGQGEERERETNSRRTTEQDQDKKNSTQRKPYNPESRSQAQHGQYNDAIADEHGDFKESDKDWEKYYRGGSAKKEKEKKENKWDGPSKSRKLNEYGNGHYGGKTDGSSERRDGQAPLTGKVGTDRRAQEREDGKKAFDEYMSSLRPKEKRDKPTHDAIGTSTINTREIEISLKLKTQSKSGQLFDIEEETTLMDLIDNIVVIENTNRKTYALHCPMLLHCHVYFSGKEYDFTLTGRLTEIEGEEQEILNIELNKYEPTDLDNLLTLFTERQNNITNFIYAAQGRE